MSDTLTASFCERCGTRHEFRAPTGLGPLRKTRGFIGGLRNYIAGDDALSDAMREGMQTQESLVAAAQIDAFHASIHLCIDCRQYTCNDCWNANAGRCRSCAPLPGIDDLADRIAASLDAPTTALTEPAAVPVFEHPTATPLPAESWPMADHEVYATSAVDTDGPGYAVALVPPEPTFDEEPAEIPEDELITAEAEPELPSEPEPVAAEASDEAPPELDERPPLRVVAWDDDTSFTDAEQRAAETVEAEPEPYAATTLPDDEPSPIAAAVAYEPEPVVFETQPEIDAEPEPMAAAAEPEPIAAESEPQHESQQPPAAGPARPAPRRSGPMRDRTVRLPTASPRAPRPAVPVAAESESEEVAARRAQLEQLGLGEPSEESTPPETARILPYRARGAAMSNREATAAAIREGSLLWEASAREVGAAGVTVQSCGGCGLALSASARFCRRCGTRQAQSA